MITAVLLAAGRGKRMHSLTPKVLHKVAGQPLLFYSLKLLKQLPTNDIQVVIGYKKDIVKKAALNISKELKINKIGFSVQRRMLGTGNAVDVALNDIPISSDHVLVLNGDDSFLYKPQTIKNVLDLHHKSRAHMTFVTLKVGKPVGYGRIVRDRQGKVIKIIEEKAANREQLKTREINDGCYVFRADWLRKFIQEIPKSVTGPPRPTSGRVEAGEYYLTSLVEIGARNGAKIETYLLPDVSEWSGVNTKEDLARANQIMRLARKI